MADALRFKIYVLFLCDQAQLYFMSSKYFLSIISFVSIKVTYSAYQVRRQTNQ